MESASAGQHSSRCLTWQQGPCQSAALACACYTDGNCSLSTAWLESSKLPLAAHLIDSVHDSIASRDVGRLNDASQESYRRAGHQLHSLPGHHLQQRNMC